MLQKGYMYFVYIQNEKGYLLQKFHLYRFIMQTKKNKLDFPILFVLGRYT